MRQARVRFVRDGALYEPCQLIIERYGDKVKLTYFKKLLRAAGLEEIGLGQKVEPFDPWPVIDLLEPPETMTDSEWEQMLESCTKEAECKLSANVRRAKNTVYEIALCNNFEYFATFTIDGGRFPRDDLHGFYKKLGKWLSNYRRKTGRKIDYLLIPELHKDGKNWHMHGLLSGLPESELKRFGPTAPKALRMKGYLNWPAYAEKFGFCSLDRVRDGSAVSAYVTKYITKDVGRCVTEVGAHMYYCSQGLKRKERICRMSVELEEEEIEHLFDFSNEWVASVTVSLSDGTYDSLCEQIVHAGNPEDSAGLKWKQTGKCQPAVDRR